jgi:membrane peptidoglycan carboxypeptidase
MEIDRMPSVLSILIARRKRDRQTRGALQLGLLALVALATAVVVIGLLLLSVSRRYAAISSSLPPAELIESQFTGEGGERAPLTTRLYDRTGQHALRDAFHPLAQDRRWVSLDPGSDSAAPQSLVDAVIAFHDPGYWEETGHTATQHLREAAALLFPEGGMPAPQGISQQLAGGVIGLHGHPAIDPAEYYLQTSILAGELEASYSKTRLLEWYLNGAYFGNLAYGIDAAALVYFDKHASDLSLAESAMLAPIPREPGLNPIDSPEAAKQRQVQTLLALLETGRISQAQADQALAAPLDLRSAQAVRDGLKVGAFERYVANSLRDILGPDFIRWSGYRVKTSLDAELQSQAECGLEYFLNRAGGEAGQSGTSRVGEDCPLNELLPVLRPGDIESDLRIEGAAAVVMDAASGEVLAMVDRPSAPGWAAEAQLQAASPKPGGDMALPFLYLTAFSRGYSPGSMVLDIPLSSASDPVAQPGRDEIDWGSYHGPTSMRRALANAYWGAAENTLGIVGEDQVLRILRSVGFRSLSEGATLNAHPVVDAEARMGLLDLAHAHGALANLGRMVGRTTAGESATALSSALEPISVTRIVGPGGEELFTSTPRERLIVSPELAYLVTDVLSDPEARAVSGGAGAGVDVGRPTALYATSTPGLGSDWAVSYTPGKVAAVWLEHAGGGSSVSSPAVRASALGKALLAYAVRDTPVRDWEVPAGITRVEVCFPSGLLPTEYCPVVNKEPFIRGTEPTAFDNLYRPFLLDRETGDLATLFTPLELVEERVYMIPPPEASEWARSAGVESPPQEYDAYRENLPEDPDLAITSPTPFSYLRGWVWVRGDVRVSPLSYFRLQYGPGLNPTRWIQVGREQRAPVVGGSLGLWDVRDLDGLYTLQLIAVLDGGRVRMAAVPVTIDNQPPSIKLVAPTQGEALRLRDDRELVIEAQVSDSIALSRVEFYVGGRRIGVRENEPFSAHWNPDHVGEVAVFVRAFDEAGNLAESERRTVHVVR